MRNQLGQILDEVGVREPVVRWRDHLVNFLTGNQASDAVRRNRRDDFHLELLIRFGLRPSSNYLDVGANQGHFLQGVSSLAPRGHHIAYEPLPHLSLRLLQRFPEVEVRQAALSDREGEFPFIHVLGDGNQGYSSLVDGDSRRSAFAPELETQTIMVRTERLDEHLPAGWLPHIIKIDVEGAELLVLRGAMDTLRRAKPVIAFEHGWGSEGSDELYGLLCDDVGLRIFDMDGHGPLDRSQFLDGLASRWNWIAHE